MAKKEGFFADVKRFRIAKALDLPKTFWMKLGKKIAILVRGDAEKGIFQNDAKNLQYLSQQYKKYKANDMRRFTTGEGEIFTDASGYFFGTTYFRAKKAGVSKKKGFGTGQRLKAYYGKSIKSREVGFVNMKVTGKLLDSLKPVKAIPFGVTMGFSPSFDNPEKLYGNERYGRVLVGLNKKNTDIVLDIITGQIDKNLRDWAKEDININVGW